MKHYTIGRAPSFGHGAYSNQFQSSNMTQTSVTLAALGPELLTFDGFHGISQKVLVSGIKCNNNSYF